MSEPTRPKEMAAGNRKPTPRPSETEMAVYNYLLSATRTREERRLAVLQLLRQASKSLDRSA